MSNIKNSFAQKMVIVLIIVVLMFNFIFPVKSHADDVDWVGPLFSPIQALVCGLGDAVFNFLQPTFIDGAPKAVFKTTLDEVRNGKKSFLEKLPYKIPVIGKAISWLDAWGYNNFGIGDEHTSNADMDGDGTVTSEENYAYNTKEIVFPSIYYSVENIFANKIPAFDVNFVNPSVEPPDVIENTDDRGEEAQLKIYFDDNKSEDDEHFADIESSFRVAMKKIEDQYNSRVAEIVKQNPGIDTSSIPLTKEEEWVYNLNVDIKKGKVDWTQRYNEAKDMGIEISVTPSETKIEAIGNTAKQMQGTISKWYNTLRDLALVVMLSVLVYVAIRIIISSTTEQAKYKTMLKDWLMAICILFIMHYIMAFTLYLTESLTNMIYGSYIDTLNNYQNSTQQSTQSTNNTQAGQNTNVNNTSVNSTSGQNTNVNNTSVNSTSGQNTNNQDLSEKIKKEQGSITAQTLATSIRLAISLPEDTLQEMGYTILYALFVFYTIMFTWQYFKRVIYMAFLTLIGPLVAITYPIDKIGDGKAQGFNMWLKEYVFNLLLQPLHLLLYTILAVSAMDLFMSNILYSLIILGFLSQSIKIIRKFFGFDSKAPIGSGYTSGFAGGAVFSTMLSTLQRIPSLGSGGKGSKGSSSGSKKGDKINFASSNNIDNSIGLGAFNDGSEGGTPTGGPTGGGPTGGPAGGGPAGGGPTGGGPTGGGPTGGGPTGGAPGGRGKRGRNQRPKGGPIARLKRIIRPPRALRASGSERIHLKDKLFDTGKKIAKTPVGHVVGGTIKGGLNVGKYVLPKGATALTKLAVAGIGAGTLGTLGVAAGLAGDDYADVFKYGVAGTVGGYAVGKSTYGAVTGLASGAVGTVADVTDTFVQGYRGDKYDEVKANKEWDKSEEVEKHLRKEFGEEWKKIKKEQKELRKLGVYNQKDLDTAAKLMNKNPGLTTTQAAGIIRFRDSNNITISDMRDDKKRNAIRTDVGKLVGNDNEKMDRIMKLMDQSLGRPT